MHLYGCNGFRCFFFFGELFRYSFVIFTPRRKITIVFTLLSFPIEKALQDDTSVFETQCNSSLEDWSRVKYLDGYIKSLREAIRNGSNAEVYFIWSLDSLELLGAYKSSYNLYYSSSLVNLVTTNYDDVSLDLILRVEI
ncbi:hypothetical protein DVH24_038946 [Malus domestica]|uniref:Uncharacterized protein n=1 Tax=Malus domestica TaxID=3750 RepID=A0A498KGE2_MALDO|nr:hypothetical protein DVH24_038946 [Malus domestica]